MNNGGDAAIYGVNLQESAKAAIHFCSGSFQSDTKQLFNDSIPGATRIADSLFMTAAYQQAVPYYEDMVKNGRPSFSHFMRLGFSYQNLNDFDKAIIISGDGDFRCLVEHLEKNDKLLKVMAPNKHFSGFLRQFNQYIVRVDMLRDALEYKPKATKKTKISGRSKP